MSLTSPKTAQKSYQIDNNPVPKIFLGAEIVISLIYLSCILFWIQKGDPVLFAVLAISETFHIWLLISLIFTIWPRVTERVFDIKFKPIVDIYITVVNEPIEIIRETIRSCKTINYKLKNIYVLNDGLVCKNPNWRDVVELASAENVNCITREIAGGAKAGNINNALRTTTGSFIAVFDADHAPYSNFLEATVPYFGDSRIAFVQSPQYYKNFLDNPVTLGATEQQELFFGPIMNGKNNLNSAFMCGTNMIIRREALEQVGGLSEHNIAEDFMTSLLIHKKGWKSIYIPTILAEGLAPEDFLSYCKQQFRWARGSMEILFWHNPFFSRGLTWQQKLNYFISASYYLSGIIVIANMITPLIFLVFGIEPLHSSTMILPVVFLPYIVFAIIVLNVSTNSGYTFKALAFSNGSFWIFCKALFSVLLKQKTSFEVTSKQKLSGNFVKLVSPHIAYIVLGALASAYSITKVGLTPAVLTNICWFVFNVITFLPFIAASLPEFKPSKIFDSLNSKISDALPKRIL
jgi:cellulose synthase (UDP-forming)